MEVNHHADVAFEKHDASGLRDQLPQIIETRNQLRGYAIILAQEAVDWLKPGMPVDLVLDLDSFADVAASEVHASGAPVKRLSMCQSMRERVIKARRLLAKNKQQLKSLGLTAPLFDEVFRCCVPPRTASEESSHSDDDQCTIYEDEDYTSDQSSGEDSDNECEPTLSSEDARALNLPHTPE